MIGYEKDSNQTFPASKYTSIKDWPHYITVSMVKNRFPEFTDDEKKDLRILKCFVESSGGSFNTQYSYIKTTMAGRRLQEASPKVQEYIKGNPGFLGKKRRQQVGQIGKMSMQPTNGGRWFSVDNHGYVRYHYLHTSGYYYS